MIWRRAPFTSGLTPFRRTHLAIALTAFLAMLAASTVARAQSFDDAVRANVALATRTCAASILTGTPPDALFGAAGFAYRGVDRGTNDYGVRLGTAHYFDAPADTAKAEVPAIGQRIGFCKVMSAHLPEVPFAALVAQVLMQDYPATQTTGRHQWTIRRGAELPLIVSVRTIERHRYEAPGTVQVTMDFPG